MKSLFIVCKDQFGYHTDIYKWCEYLRPYYNVEVLSFYNKPKIELDGIKVHYVQWKGTRIVRGTRFLIKALRLLCMFKGLIIVCYFNECYYLKKILFWKKLILDIRTLDISKEKERRVKEDKHIIRAANVYDFVTIISNGIRNKIHIPEDKSFILPLGADIVPTTKKTYKKLKLLYVGILYNRNIDLTIKGLFLFKQKNPQIEISYDIIGFGDEDLLKCKRLVEHYSLADIVTFHGYVPHSELRYFYDRSNIGISFIPITDYYEYQPATKTFEYVLSGLYTIATNTYSNREVISSENGILIQDNERAFANALEQFLLIRENLDSSKIQKSLMHYSWKNIVEGTLLKILKIIEKRYDRI